jgi:hypothetical protein
MIKLADQGTPFLEGYINGRLDDPDLQDVLWAYKRRVAGNYRPITPDEIGLLPSSSYLVSEKIDGELWFLVIAGRSAYLVNPYGRVMHGNLPILKAAVKLDDGLILAGELYVKREEVRARVGDLRSYFADPDKTSGRTLAFCVFDVVRGNEALEQQAYDARYSFIKSAFSNAKAIEVVNHVQLESASEIATLFADKVLSGHAEGLIVRLPTGLIYKVKPIVELDAVVVAYTSRLEKPSEARSVLLALAVDENKYQVIGACGNLGTEGDRVALLERLGPMACDSSVRISSDSGGLYKFVKPSLVVQIKVTDLQTERADGGASLGHRVELNGKGWSSVGMFPTARLIHPVLLRTREDKEVNTHDVRVSQLDGFLSLANENASSGDLAKSEILRREVWVKETKGVKAVRKLLVWKTNKEKTITSMPAFVVHWTDYSPGRASPLDREVKLAPTLDAATEIADQIVEANIKKGWEKQ